MSGVFEHLHIKKNTVGSSNELSFDVLDNARSGLDGKTARSSKLATASLAKRGSYHGVSGMATFSGQAEVEKRKRSRKMRNYAFWAVAALAVLVVACAILWIGYRHYLEAQDFATRYDSLVNQFAEEDGFISEVDGLLATLDDESAVQARSDALAKIPEMIEGVERIKTNAASARPLAVDDRDEKAVDKVIQSADVRVEMLSLAQKALVLNVEKEEKERQVNAIWNDVVDSVQNAKEASAQANDAMTEESTTEALEKTRQSYDEINEAIGKLKALEADSQRIDFTVQRNYLEEKARSLEYAVQTGEALLEGDRQRAQELNEQYNESDKKAAAFAQDMPLSPDVSVYEGFEPQLQGYIQGYDACRERAAQIDAEVRSYLKSR